MPTLQDIIDSAGDQQWTDDDFPPEPSSLIADWTSPEVQEYTSTWKTYEWIRATEIESLNDEEGDLALFFNDIEVADIKQGALGDCYFLSVLSMLTEYPDRVRKLFVNHELNPQGVIGVNLCKNGEKQTIFLDNYLPCGPGGAPCFTQANGNELWVLMLEKAWAKIHGSYERIVAGQSHLTYRDLTGAPSFEFQSSEEGSFDKILDADIKKYAISCSINSQDPEEEKRFKELGLVCGHAYGIIAAARVNTPEGEVELVQIRNPWGHFEWKGDWGDKSEKWTDDLKAELNFVDADDGCFWMSFEDMKKFFSRVQISKINDDYHYNFHKVVDPESEYQIILFRIEQTGEYTLSVSQVGERMYPRDSGYKYSNSRMILVRLNNGQDLNDGVTYIKGDKGFYERDAYLELE